ncbi:hypothetical protein B0H10DRAFT_1744269, partial [Mycena sp. CBHHK59/15]
IENYSRDVKEATRIIRSHAGCPSFTEDGWKDVLEGNYVNFDEIARELLDLTRITTQGQWVDAWRKYRRCVVFAFEGRNEELDAYFDYIQGLFSQAGSEFAHNVIGCDKAIRMFIGTSKATLFNDLPSFAQYERSYLIPGMVHYHD